MADNDFPRLLYKKSEGGNAQHVWDLGTFEVARANDETEVGVLLAEGWTLRPDDEPAKPAKAVREKASA